MSELIITSSAQAYIIPGDSPMTSVANTVAMTYFAVHTLQPLIFYMCTCCTQLIRHQHIPKLISLDHTEANIAGSVLGTVEL